MNNHIETKDRKKPQGLKRLLAFLLFAVILIALSFFTPLGELFNKEDISRLASEHKYLGPIIIIVCGILSPLLFMPRWPIAFASGMIYGIVWGTLLATFASTLGALLHYYMATTLLAPAAAKVVKKFKLSESEIPKNKMFMFLFFLRAFPLSNFIATNLLAGALKVSLWLYVSATFFGMLPSSIMYTSCGKLMKEPDSSFTMVAVFSVLFIIAGTIIAQKKFYPWLKSIRQSKTDENGA